MRKFREYNLLKLAALILICTVAGGLLIGLVAIAFGVDLFDRYLGLPGFLLISVVVLVTHQAIERLDGWLTR